MLGRTCYKTKQYNIQQLPCKFVFTLGRIYQQAFIMLKAVTTDIHTVRGKKQNPYTLR